MKFRLKADPDEMESPENQDQVLLRREILARKRVIKKHSIHVKRVHLARVDALYAKQAGYRLVLVVFGLIIVLILVRLLNDALYFSTGVDYHLLGGLLS